MHPNERDANAPKQLWKRGTIDMIPPMPPFSALINMSDEPLFIEPQSTQSKRGEKLYPKLRCKKCHGKFDRDLMTLIRPKYRLCPTCNSERKARI